MKTQIRPRILIPVVAVAVVVAAAAVWKLTSSGGEDPAPSATPAAGDASSADLAAGALDTGAGTQGGWAQQANAACASATSASGPAAGEQPASIPLLTQKLEGQRGVIAQLQAVQAPEASVAQLAELVGVLEQQVVLSRDALAAVENGKLKRATKTLDAIGGLSKQRDELAAALGLTDCGTDRASTPTLGDLKLARAIGDGRPVVVVLYSSGAGLDTAVLREARSAAGSVGAGFVALDGTRENDGGAIARVAGLRATPSTVVLRRDLGVASVIPGFADRETIAQAVANARRVATSS